MTIANYIQEALYSKNSETLEKNLESLEKRKEGNLSYKHRIAIQNEIENVKAALKIIKEEK